MTSTSWWDAILGRLEADVARRERGAKPEELDEAAWYEVERFLRALAQRPKMAGLLRSAEDHGEILVEVLLKLRSMDTLRRVKTAGSPEGYLVVIMQHLAVDRIRKLHREEQALAELSYDYELYRGYPTEVTDERKEEAARLKEILAELPPEERYLIRARFWRKLTIEQIAGETRRSYSATASRLVRIVTKIRSQMQGWSGKASP